MKAKVTSLVKQWSNATDSLLRSKICVQLTEILTQSPQLVGIILKLDGGPSALVVGVYNLDATSGSLQASRDILHALAEVLCHSKSSNKHVAALRAAKPIGMLSLHIGRLRPLFEPDPDRLEHMNAAERQKAVMRAVHISEMAMLLHRLVPGPWELQRALIVIATAVPWMTAVARHCLQSYGSINAITSGPAALLACQIAAPDKSARPELAELLRLLPHVVSTLQLGCPPTLLQSGTESSADICLGTAAELLSALLTPVQCGMDTSQLSSFLIRCNAFPLLSAYIFRYTDRPCSERDAVIVPALEVVQCLLNEMSGSEIAQLTISEPLLVNRISNAMYPPPPGHPATSITDLLQLSASARTVTSAGVSTAATSTSGRSTTCGFFSSSNSINCSPHVLGGSVSHQRLLACTQALYTISLHCPEAVARSNTMTDLLRVVILLPERIACHQCIDAAWYASGCYTAVAQQCSLKHAAQEALDAGMLTSVAIAAQTAAAVPNSKMAQHSEHWVLCINFFLDFVPQEGARQALAAGARDALVSLITRDNAFKLATMVLLRMAEELTDRKDVLFATGLVPAVLDRMEICVAETYRQHMKGNKCTIQQAAGRGASHRDPFPNIDPFSAISILLYQTVSAGAATSAEFERARRMISTAVIVGPGQRSHGTLNSILQAAKSIVFRDEVDHSTDLKPSS